MRDALQGLQPDEAKHQSYMDIEPITGSEYPMISKSNKNMLLFFIKLAVMNGSRRMQINLNVVNNSQME